MGVDAVDFLLRHGHLVLFGVVLGEQLGLPLLGAPVLMAAGALAGMGRFSLPSAVGLAVAACLLADLAWYHLGRRRGASALTLLCRISLEPDSCVRRTEDLFARWGARVLLAAKFLPGLNTVAPPLSGVVGMPLGRFLRYDAGGSTLWAGAYVGLGYLFRHQLEAVARVIGQLGHGAAGLVGGALAAYVAWKWIQRRRFLRSLRAARITPEELMARMRAGDEVLVVDLRSADHVAREGLRIPGALHVRPEELERRHREIARHGEIVVYCS
jgi:membrane protein DedA with SNARE-associated domain